MTSIGLNPSFADTYSRLPIFANAINRGRMFEVFNELGEPTKEPSPLGPDGWPVNDGRRHGVRLFGDMAGTVPSFQVDPVEGLMVRKNANAATVAWRGDLRPTISLSGSKWFIHEPSVEALRQFKPAVLRTLDWQRTNERIDWRRPRVRMSDPLQCTSGGMAVETQALIAGATGAHLWWCAPPRYDLPSDQYEARLEEYLTQIRRFAGLPPILEYGNELWNAQFPVHGWLQSLARPDIVVTTWHDVAAAEIATLKRVADRVFGAADFLGGKKWYLFVGGQLTVPSHLDRILDALKELGVKPDLAGPACYVTPLKASKEEWERTGAVPTQDELRQSMFARLKEITRAAHRDPGGVDGPLAEHGRIVSAAGVPYFACYEAGQSLIARDARGRALPWRQAAIAAQREEWMGDLYRGILASLEDVDLLNWYSAATPQNPPESTDVFGLLEGLGMPLLPKARAAMGQ